MAATAKSLVMMRSLKDNLKKRMPSTYVFTDGSDADGNPVLLVSADATPATTEQVAMLRIAQVTNVFLNGIGGTQENVAPHYVDLTLEADGTLTSSARLTLVNMTAVMGEAMRQTGLTRVYLLASGTVPAIADVGTQNVAANLVASYTTELSYLLAGA